MKKVALLSLAMATAVAASAGVRDTGGKNLIVNGSFDAEGYVQSIPSDWSWAPMNEWNNLESMPGWTISGGGIWNGGMEIKVDDDFLGDDEVRSSKDNTFLRFFTDSDNMWAAEIAAQVVSVESGKTYKLECAVMGKNATKKDDGSEMASEWKIRVCEIDKDATGTTIAGKELYVFDLTGKEMPGGWFEKRSFDVKATADKLWVEIYYVSWCDEGVNRDEYGWFCIDDVDLYDPDGEFSTAIKNVNFDENEPIEYYTLGGVRVGEPTHGVYIMRQGNKAVKGVVK